MLRWFRNLLAATKREARIPAPPFRASKRTGKIMNGLWYGRITPDQARATARAWGFAAEDIEQMIADATKPPSYWSQHPRAV